MNTKIMNKIIKYFVCLSLLLFISQGNYSYTEDNTDPNKKYFINEQNLKIKRFLHKEEINAVAISPDGKIAAAVIHDLVPNRHFIDFIRFINLDGTNSEISDIIPEGHKGMTQIHNIAFSPNGKYLAFEDINGGSVSMFQIWNIYENKKIFEIAPTRINKSSFEFLNDNKHIMISYGNYMSKGSPSQADYNYIETVRIWDFLSNIEEKIIKHPEKHTLLMNYCKLSPDSKYFASSCFGNSKKLLIWDITKGTIYKEFSIEGVKYEGWIEGFSFSKDGRILVFVTDIFPKNGGRVSGKRIRFWDIEKDKIISSFDTNNVFDIDIINLHKDGKKLIMSGNGMIHVYDIDKQKIILKTNPIMPGRPPVCFNAEKELMAFGTPYESHFNKSLRYLLICDLKEKYENN